MVASDGDVGCRGQSIRRYQSLFTFADTGSSLLAYTGRDCPVPHHMNLCMRSLGLFSTKSPESSTFPCTPLFFNVVLGLRGHSRGNLDSLIQALGYVRQCYVNTGPFLVEGWIFFRKFPCHDVIHCILSEVSMKRGCRPNGPLLPEGGKPYLTLSISSALHWDHHTSCGKHVIYALSRCELCTSA